MLDVYVTVTWPIQRTLIRQTDLLGKSNCMGYVTVPLIHIEPKCCPPDILHMKKRILSRQIDQVLEWVICQGKTEIFQDELKSKNINVDMGLVLQLFKSIHMY